MTVAAHRPSSLPPFVPAANVTGVPPTGGSLDPAYKSASRLTQETYAWRPTRDTRYTRRGRCSPAGPRT